MDLEVLVDAERTLGVDRPTLLILGRPTCDDCQAFYARLATWTPPRPITVLTLNLRAAEGEAFRALNPWTKHVDFVPFNVLYLDGEIVDEWTGGDLERLQHALSLLEG